VTSALSFSLSLSVPLCHSPTLSRTLIHKAASASPSLDATLPSNYLEHYLVNLTNSIMHIPQTLSCESHKLFHLITATSFSQCIGGWHCAAAAAVPAAAELSGKRK